jgi:hypothetical protein
MMRAEHEPLWRPGRHQFVKYDRAVDGVAALCNIRAEFEAFFSDRRYIREPPIGVIDAKRVDPSTRFIGSHTSVLKPYMYGRAVPRSGIWIVQPCLQTQNLVAYETDDLIYHGSVLECHGLLAPYAELERLVLDVHSYFGRLLVPQEDLVVAVAQADNDVVAAVRGAGFAYRWETEELLRHSFGDPRLCGRDACLEIVANGKRIACGVIIVIELDETPAYVEAALAPGRIVQAAYHLEHYLDLFPVVGLPAIDDFRIRVNLEDAICALVLMAREGLRPGGSDNRRRIMRRYLARIERYCRAYDITTKQLIAAVGAYEGAQYGGDEACRWLAADAAQWQANADLANNTRDVM